MKKAAIPCTAYPPRLVVGLPGVDVPCNLVDRDASKGHFRSHNLANRDAGIDSSEGKARINFMFPAAQLLQHSTGFSGRLRLSQHLTADRHDGVRPQDPAFGMQGGDSLRLAAGKPLDMGFGRLPPQKGFVRPAGEDPEVHPQKPQQLRPAGRRGSEDERRGQDYAHVNARLCQVM